MPNKSEACTRMLTEANSSGLGIKSIANSGQLKQWTNHRVKLFTLPNYGRWHRSNEPKQGQKNENHKTESKLAVFFGKNSLKLNEIKTAHTRTWINNFMNERKDVKSFSASRRGRQEKTTKPNYARKCLNSHINRKKTLHIPNRLKNFKEK